MHPLLACRLQCIDPVGTCWPQPGLCSELEYYFQRHNFDLVVVIYCVVTQYTGLKLVNFVKITCAACHSKRTTS